MKKKLLALLLTAAMAVSLLPMAAFADETQSTPRTLYVNNASENTETPDGTEAKPFATVAAAITEASAGDTINIAAGTYDAFIVNKANLTFVGDVGADTGENLVTIKTMYSEGNPTITDDGNTTGWGGVEIRQSASFENLDFVSYGYAPDDWAKGYGAPISVNFLASGTAATSLSVKDCNFTLADELEGAVTSTAIFLSISNVTIESCTFEGFTTGYCAMSDGGAVNNLVITDNTFTNVEYPVNVYYGAVLPDNATGITITGNTIENTAEDATSTIVIHDYAQSQEKGAGIKATITDNEGAPEITLTHVNMTATNEIVLDSAAAENTTVLHKVTVNDSESGYASATVTSADGKTSYPVNQSNGTANLPVTTDMTFKDADGEDIVVSGADPVTITYTTSGGASTSVQAAVQAATPAESGNTGSQAAALKGVNQDGTVSDDTLNIPAASEVYAAQVGATKYATLAEALTAAQSMTNPTIEILSDLTIETWTQIEDTENWTIKGNGYTLTVKAVNAGNGGYLFHDAKNMNVSDLTVDFKTNGNGFYIHSGKLENVHLNGGADSVYGVAVGVGGTVELVNSSFENFKTYGVAGDNYANASDIVIKDSTITGSAVSVLSYAEETTLTGNTISGEISLAGTLNSGNTAEDVSYVITGNTFESASVKLHNANLDNVTFSENNIDANSSITVVDNDSYSAVTGTLDVNNNYWGSENGPTEEQIKLPEPGEDGTKIEVKDDVFYKAETMNPSDLNTYRPSSSGGGVTTYAITAPSVENGTVTASSKNAAKNATVTLTVTPADGYELDTLTVTDKDGKEVTLTQGTDGKYTFKMPASKVTVSATFKAVEEPAPTMNFADVNTGDWFYDEVEYVFENGIMNGTSETTFAPGASTTRAMVWTMLARLSGETISGADWADQARAWAMAAGVSDGTNADGDVTREQLGTMLYRYAELKGYDLSAQGDLSKFLDGNTVSDWANAAMVWANGAGIITGDDQNQVNPLNDATRAEVAAMFMRFCENIVK